MPIYLHKYKHLLKPYVSRWVHCYSSCPSGMVTEVIVVGRRNFIVFRRYEQRGILVPIEKGLAFAESVLASLE